MKKYGKIIGLMLVVSSVAIACVSGINGAVACGGGGGNGATVTVLSASCHYSDTSVYHKVCGSAASGSKDCGPGLSYIGIVTRIYADCFTSFGSSPVPAPKVVGDCTANNVSTFGECIVF